MKTMTFVMVTETVEPTTTLSFILDGPTYTVSATRGFRDHTVKVRTVG